MTILVRKYLSYLALLAIVAAATTGIGSLAAQERDEIICEMFAAKFRECVSGQTKSVRQLRVALWNLSPRPAQGLLFP